MNFRRNFDPILKKIQRFSAHCYLPITVVVTLFILGLPNQVEGVEIQALSASRKDVGAAVAIAMNGDTVLIPAGTVNWTNTLVIVNKAITLQGAGTNATILVDEIADRQSLFRVTFANRVGMFRITGLQIKGGSFKNPSLGMINIIGSDFEFGNSAWRMDHLYFNKQFGRPFYINAWSGLIDNCYFDQNSASGITFDGRVPDASNKGHRSWATPVRWGTVDAGVYVESCFVTNSVQRAITDGFAGARFVFRYNTCYNVSAENHGTESTGVFRGTRAMEIYGNKFTSAAAGECAVLFRSGTGLVFSNSVSGRYPALMRLANFRERDVYVPYGQATGLNPWDQNFPDIFASGGHTGTNNSALLVDNTASWTANQWVGCHVQNMISGKNGQILSNTATTISFWLAGITPTNNPSWNTGDPYKVVKINRELDGVGQGKGDLLVGGSNTPLLSPSPIGWPNQADEPVHYWDNTGITALADAGYSAIIAGRNYTNSPLAGYTPLVYPHPYTSEDPLLSRTAAPTNLRAIGSH